MFFLRNIAKNIENEINTKEIIVLTGMRRVGKTTLLKNIFNKIDSNNKLFLDLENPLNRKLFEEDNFDNILSNLQEFNINKNEKIYLFLDEIQLMPEITKTVKYLYDNYNIKFFLTSSSSFYLKNLFPESLSGRKIVYELFPLTFHEFLTFKKESKKYIFNIKEKTTQTNKFIHEKYKGLYEEYLQYGGFPQVVLENDIERKKIILLDIFKSYFEQDLKTMADFKNINKIRDLILLLSKRVGSKFNITKLSQELGLSRETIYSYLNFLENTFFIFFISQQSKSIDKRVSGLDKVYFCDNGIINILKNTDNGSLLENSIFLNLQQNNDITYYNNRENEIDFILNNETGIEVKNKANIKDVNRLNKLAKKLKIKNTFIVTKEYFEHEKSILALNV